MAIPPFFQGSNLGCNIIPGGGGGALSGLMEGELTCFPNDIVTLNISGGVPPYSWVILDGDNISLSSNTGPSIQVQRINNGGTDISYFKVYINSFLFHCNTGQAVCDPFTPPAKYRTEYTVSSFLLGYDCNGNLSIGNKDLSTVNVAVAGPGGRFPLGPLDQIFEYTELSFDQVCDFTTGSSCNESIDNPTSNLKNKNYQVSACMCCDDPDINGSLRIFANIAGRNGYNGVIHAAAPIYDEIVNIPSIPIGGGCNSQLLSGSSGAIDAVGQIDVRTQDMVDDGCCFDGPATIVVEDSNADQFIFVLV